jgi:hypothetical protein
VNRLARLARIYPLLASVYPVFHLAASNAGEWVQPSDIAKPLMISAGVTAFLWLVGARLTQDPDKRAFLTFLGVLAFIGGRWADDGLMVVLPGMRSNPALTSLPVLLVLGFCAVVGTVYTRRPFGPATRFLGVTWTVLMTFATIQLVYGRLAQATAADTFAPIIYEQPVTSSRNHPTIFLIVLDKYQGTSTLRSYYGYDNSSFERALRERGFLLPARPRANYTHTRQAMSALLNWESLDSIVAQVGVDETNLAPLFQRVENNRTFAFLKGLGYELVFFPNAYEPFRENRFADLQLPDPKTIKPEFETAWIETTLIVPIARVLCSMIACVYVPGVPEPAALTDWKFAQLGALAASPHPRFVLAHLLVPHEPYVYQADCRHVPPSLIWRDSAATRSAYLDQITCVNAKVLAAVDAILLNAPSPPVILIQADHGNGHIPRDNLELKDADARMVAARVDVFAAYYVPNASDTLFYDGITPVNLLPRVFNFLFGTTFQPRPDKSYWAVENAPYRLTPIPLNLTTETP